MVNDNRIFILVELGKIIFCSGLIIHNNMIPIKIAVGLIIIIGMLEKLFEWFWILDLCLMSVLFDRYIIRNEYKAVILTEEIINSVNIHSNFEDINFSMIISFEKYPEVNGNPINAMFVILNEVNVDGMLELFLIIRISWYEDSWIIVPAHINISDLKNAWTIIWKYANIIDEIEIANIIIAICLNVDKAIIFFRSCSQFADILA